MFASAGVASVRFSDMDYPVDCADAFVITSAERAADLPRPTVLIHAAAMGTADLPQEDQAHDLHDIGSGLLRPHPLLPDEPDAATSLADGASVVTASGDKLLGGPQAGLVLGRADVVERLRRHPLARALRADKTTLAGLEARSGAVAGVGVGLASSAAALRVEPAARAATTITVTRAFTITTPFLHPGAGGSAAARGKP